MILSDIGLIVIAAGWFVQLAVLFKGNNEINPLFVIIYMLGVLLIAVGDTVTTGPTSAVLEIITVIISGLVLAKLLLKKQA